MTYESVRIALVQAIEAEMMGPGSECPMGFLDPMVAEHELISESPLQRYSVGLLYEQGTLRDPEDESAEGRSADERAEIDELLDIATTTANQYYPSSVGMSFYASGRNPAMSVQVAAARYRRVDVHECVIPVGDVPEEIRNNPLVGEYLALENGSVGLRVELSRSVRDELAQLEGASQTWKGAVYDLYNLQTNGWRRIPLRVETVLQAPPCDTAQPTRESVDICDGLKLICVRRPEVAAHTTLFTLAIVNDFRGGDRKRDEQTFFQVGLSARPVDPNARLMDYEIPLLSTADDPEEQSMALLYRNRRVLGVGHGCAVSWDEGGTTIWTQVIPSYEVAASEFHVDELEPVRYALSMRDLSDLSSMTKQEIILSLTEFVNTYREWIKKKRREACDLEGSLRSTADKHLANCDVCAERLMRGVWLLDHDDVVFQAFQLANRAMLMQRMHSGLQRTKRYPDDEGPVWPDYRRAPAERYSWRPFQLAFILLNMDSISDPTSADREVADLIWFPTGGGKTEAYLGLSAFCVFLRRMRLQETGAGTAIIMRYTLRLLTAQQFQRASTLICACELIRREAPEVFGRQPMTIGLWIGSSATPNTVDDAARRLDLLVNGSESECPFQVLTCPWCGTRLTKDHQRCRGRWGYRIGSRPKSFVIFCTESTCPFHDELPLLILDEDIYRSPPTLLLGTVDKFALIPWKREAGVIFGLGLDVASPELIIQDELHLISGPLGTIVGLYETAIDLLCSKKGLPPKIVASTATIRRANDQVRALFNREVRVFPPSATEAEDSFFAREASASGKPGRMYVGLMATGKTLTFTQVRLMSAILQSVAEMECDAHAKDPYWTLVCYFNTIRELGRCSTLALDDIKDQIRRIAFRRGTKRRVYSAADELTGSRRSADIPQMLDRMEISYPDERAIHILLASSMISVGIDIDRLGLMCAVSQPKTTSEYIQATSRVGRKFPGLVITLYDGARPRDRSHYERFSAYHQALYRYVEPTSVTPFSGPARDRALGAVLVSLVRHALGLCKDNQAGQFSADIPGLGEVITAIVDRATAVMPEEADATAADLERLVHEWETIAEANQPLTYSSSRGSHLLYVAGRENDRHWATMQSMRSVDAPGNIRVVDLTEGDADETSEE